MVDYEALGFGEDVCEDVMWTLHEMIEAGVESGEVGRGGGGQEAGWLLPGALGLCEGACVYMMPLCHCGPVGQIGHACA